MSKFVSYNSSAGSGKTFTLVKEYLKIALETDDYYQYRKILAITFTNKAATEMKERVLEALKALSSNEKLEGTPQFLMQELCKPIAEGGLGVAPEKIAERSGKVFKSILHNYNDFGISTIDKFTHKIIRTFAHDLQLPLNFSVEIEEEDVLKASIDMLITEVGNNEKLTKLLIEYAVQKSDDEENWNIERDLLLFSKKLLKDEGEIHLENIRKLSLADFDSIKEQLYAQTKSFENAVKQLGDDGMALITSKGIDPKSFSGGYFYKYWEDLKLFKKLTPNATVAGAITGEKSWYAKNKPEDQKELIDSNQGEFIKLYNASRAYISEFESSYILNKQLIKNLYNLAVLNEIEKTLQEFKQENNILNISDFNKRIAKIVSSEPVPFIYERLGEKYQHYLIDEFQDTSIVQWHNLLPLVDNSLANGQFNMVVGDAKQAIYRFRGGEVEQIINFPKIYKHDNNPILLEREASIERNFEEKSLDNNYRSKAEIVDFNNQFFQSVSNNLSDKYQKLYSNLEQGFDPKNNGGGISIDFLEDGQDNQEAQFNGILKSINESLADGYKLSDVAILTKGRQSGKDIAVFLLENNIQVISAESLLLNNSKEVTFILDLFRFLSLPSDKNYQVKVLTYLTQVKYKDDLFEVMSGGNENYLMSYLAKKEINLNFKEISNYALYELLEHLLITFNLIEEIDIYIQFLLDKVHEYASRNDNSILNFIEWWDLKSHNFSIVIPDGINAVQVMTIHKSKGLEFPIVLYPYATSTVKKSEDFFWTNDTGLDELQSAIVPISESLLQTKFSDVFTVEMDKSKLDLINLIYVVFTRAKDRLYIISKKNKKPSKNGSVADYLSTYCESNLENKVTENSFRFGLFSKNNAPKTAQDDNLLFKQTAYNNWRNKIQISYEAPKVWDVENPESIGEHGTLIHNVLSKINVEEDLDAALKTYELKGIIDQYEAQEIKLLIQKLFKDPSIKNLFVDFDELKNERSILLESGESYQPDRVVVKENKTYLVDYKTGERESKHIEQIDNYRNILNQMGYQNINAQLLYIKEGVLLTV